MTFKAFFAVHSKFGKVFSFKPKFGFLSGLLLSLQTLEEVDSSVVQADGGRTVGKL